MIVRMRTCAQAAKVAEACSRRTTPPDALAAPKAARETSFSYLRIGLRCPR
ncbi:hypothetical protein I553_0340 [Mycobacterium xenopi 4042]|uniref:Uncharacterized protein n=1 Tax=Mycobacterium xenopi 4042 TaxID=1299334 RepID=X7YIG7_MYCXE|nr:hypothetical protein I553_0340 [Mycobacterium xenopi 4042]EUA19362.1 hypothetical protein I552_9105 [Mycobacterium xenopi 3993]